MIIKNGKLLKSMMRASLRAHKSGNLLADLDELFLVLTFFELK